MLGIIEPIHTARGLKAKHAGHYLTPFTRPALPRRKKNGKKGHGPRYLDEKKRKNGTRRAKKRTKNLRTTETKTSDRLKAR